MVHDSSVFTLEGRTTCCDRECVFLKEDLERYTADSFGGKGSFAIPSAAVSEARGSIRGECLPLSLSIYWWWSCLWYIVYSLLVLKVTSFWWC
jgi:hypothetical protein